MEPQNPGAPLSRRTRAKRRFPRLGFNTHTLNEEACIHITHWFYVSDFSLQKAFLHAPYRIMGHKPALIFYRADDGLFAMGHVENGQFVQASSTGFEKNWSHIVEATEFV